MRPPARVALAEPVTDLPESGEYAFEQKLDGHRLLLGHQENGPVVETGRTNRNVTAQYPELAEAARGLPVGTILDGEGVVRLGQRFDFSSMQTRALSSPAKSARLPHDLPVRFVAFDVLTDGGRDLRSWPYHRRRDRLEGIVARYSDPLHLVEMTRDRRQALSWLANEELAAQGVEGVLCKPWSQPYPAGRRGWLKVRPTQPQDALAIGYTGRARAPARLVVDLGGEQGLALSTPLTVELSHVLAQALIASRTEQPPTTALLGNVPYWLFTRPVPVEVDQGTTRHAATTIRRLRPDLAR
ncbi:ATP-dependent DNA ligase [Streptomyces sp. MNP-20]|uniref:ATP-dependent DNA ligase n=1 Tax=Streptomyces sp. MNP-20 TaxID=2721165 RepID=UPI0015527B3D|nr:ATP-dependent DNA ligase [Streptomyces sp. MNP-20]